MTSSLTRLRSSPVQEQVGTSGIWVFESRHGEFFSMPTTVHRFPKLLLIREGSGQIDGDWGCLPCNTGDCVLVPPGLHHRIVDDPGAAVSLYGLGIASRLFASVPEIIEQLPAGVFHSAQLKSAAIEQRLRRILYLNGQTNAGSRLACVAASLELFAEVTIALQQSPQSAIRESALQAEIDPLLKSYLTWIEHHFFEPVTLDSAAAACGISRRHFTTTFKQYVGMTWLDYLHQLRVQHATELLRNTDRKVSSIAFQCGFDDLTTFYRVVAKITGKRPGELRTHDCT